jgi:hypothetical protein
MRAEDPPEGISFEVVDESAEQEADRMTFGMVHVHRHKKPLLAHKAANPRHTMVNPHAGRLVKNRCTPD